MKSYDAVVIGAGPAGLFAAVHAATDGSTVLVVERNAAAARKLFLAGAGRCNITHGGPIEDFLDHYGERGRFAKPALFGFSNADLVRYFETRGVTMIEEEDGRIFPRSFDPGDVLRVMLDECGSKGIALRFGDPAVGVQRSKGDFVVRTKRSQYRSRALVIATGGRSYPRTGSSGDGYRFAADLGHTVTETAPALTPVVVKGHRFGGCAGVSIQGAELSLRRDGKRVLSTHGDILFTHRGLSGPGIIDLSRYLRRGDVITLSLAGSEHGTPFEERLAREAVSRGRRSIKSLLASYRIPARLAARIIEICGLPPALKASNLDRERRRLIAEHVSGLSFTVGGLGGWNEAMVTRGGVSVDEIRRATMESRLAARLYFAGEVIDIDGDTGGYNLQFAFSSGALAGGSIARSLDATTK